MPSYTVHAYSRQTLDECLTRFSHFSNPDVVAKSHVEYLDEYFREIGAAAVLAEERYIDRDFLEDFAAYYVRCFEPYGKVCARLHFFKTAITAAEFETLFANEMASERRKEVESAYLGFIVVKPLPRTIIGRTCLINYPNGQARVRSFPVLHKYRVNLFGVDLEVPSLPFQEQDREVAACASSALWSVLNGTAKQFQHATPSPVEITRAAAVHHKNDDRTMPNNGLNANQIGDAIRSVGLEPCAVRGKNKVALRIAASAYLRAKVPSLLIAKIIKVDPKGNVSELGQHAMAIAGYSYGQNPPEAFPHNPALFRASAIDRLYCHDDQVGPFAKLNFQQNNTILTSWKPDGPGWSYQAEPVNLIVPLYHKIRVPVGNAQDFIGVFDSPLEQARKSGMIGASARIVWDLYLTEVNDFRREIHESSLPKETRLRLLDARYPKYIWRADAYADNQLRFSVLLDATDLIQGSYFLDVIPFDPAFSEQVKAFCQILLGTAIVSGSSKIRKLTERFAALQI